MKFTDNPKYKDNIILKLTFEFVVNIVLFSETLDKKGKYVVAKQILRSVIFYWSKFERSSKMLKVKKTLFIN